MSDSEVLRLVEEMEGFLEAPGALQDPAPLEGWNARFREAAATAERGAGWAGILERAHALGSRVNQALVELDRQGQALRGDLEIQGRGQRALQGYGAQGL
jgi:hypothetical protein